MNVYSPTGKRIIGTAESVLRTCYCEFIRRNEDGSLEFDHTSEDSVCWESSEQRIENGQRMFTDEDGCDWPENNLLTEEQAKEKGLIQ